MEALCAFLEDESSTAALAQSNSAQQHIFYLLHKQAQSMLGAQCQSRLGRVLEACSRCCAATDRPTLHHTMCISALQDGRLDEALEVVAALQDETRDSSMHEPEDAETSAPVACDAGARLEELSLIHI